PHGAAARTDRGSAGASQVAGEDGERLPEAVGEALLHAALPAGVAGEPGAGAAGRQIVAVLAREVAVDEAPPGARPRPPARPRPVAPVGGGDAGGASLGGEGLLGCEVVVEAAVGEAGLLHELGEPDAPEPPLSEQSPSGLNDLAAMPRRGFF